MLLLRESTLLIFTATRPPSAIPATTNPTTPLPRTDNFPILSGPSNSRPSIPRLFSCLILDSTDSSLGFGYARISLYGFLTRSSIRTRLELSSAMRASPPRIPRETCQIRFCQACAAHLGLGELDRSYETTRPTASAWSDRRPLLVLQL